MSLSIKWDELLPWAGIFLAAAVPSAIWLARSKKEKREFREAEECLASGRYVECIRHLSKADESWAFNVANATPKAIVRDFDRLISIVEMIGKATAESGTTVDAKELLSALKEARAIASDKAHYKFGSFTLKEEFDLKARHLAREIAQHRSNFRMNYMRLLE